MISTATGLNQHLSIVDAATQSTSRHILAIGGIVLGALIVVYLVGATIFSLFRVGGIWAGLGGIFGLPFLFGLVFLIASAIGASVTVALAVSGGVTFLAVLMLIGVVSLAG